METHWSRWDSASLPALHHTLTWWTANKTVGRKEYNWAGNENWKALSSTVPDLTTLDGKLVQKESTFDLASGDNQFSQGTLNGWSDTLCGIWGRKYRRVQRCHQRTKRWQTTVRRSVFLGGIRTEPWHRLLAFCSSANLDEVSSKECGTWVTLAWYCVSCNKIFESIWLN